MCVCVCRDPKSRRPRTTVTTTTKRDGRVKHIVRFFSCSALWTPLLTEFRAHRVCSHLATNEEDKKKRKKWKRIGSAHLHPSAKWLDRSIVRIECANRTENDPALHAATLIFCLDLFVRVRLRIGWMVLFTAGVSKDLLKVLPHSMHQFLSEANHRNHLSFFLINSVLFQPWPEVQYFKVWVIGRVWCEGLCLVHH